MSMTPLLTHTDLASRACTINKVTHWDHIHHPTNMSQIRLTVSEEFTYPQIDTEGLRVSMIQI